MSIQKSSNAISLIDSAGAVSNMLWRYGKLDGFFLMDDFGVGFNGERSSKSYLFVEPVFEVGCKGSHSWLRSINTSKRLFDDPWEAFELYIERPFEAFRNESLGAPFCAGFFAYEFLHNVEDVPRVLQVGSLFPDYLFFGYRTVIEIDHSSMRAIINRYEFDASFTPFWECADIECTLQAAMGSKEKSFFSVSELTSNFTRAQYEEKVTEIQELIRAGEVYQVNLSQKFTGTFNGDAADFFSDLRKRVEPSHSAYGVFSSDTGPTEIVSLSPELFLRGEGEEILTSPIKGTVARIFHDPNKDASSKQGLIASEKNLSELSMIVDVERNDLGRIATTGSVKVVEHARCESLTYVHHLISDIAAKLRHDVTLSDIVRAIFPTGSITGAPKIAAMEIISKLEGENRGIYTGSIGAIGAGGFLLFNVAIRTAMIQGNKITLSSGGGIVLDSDARSEFDETVSKIGWIGSVTK